jgi:hypothetical protein
VAAAVAAAAVAVVQAAAGAGAKVGEVEGWRKLVGVVGW